MSRAQYTCYYDLWSLFRYIRMKARPKAKTVILSHMTDSYELWIFLSIPEYMSEWTKYSYLFLRTCMNEIFLAIPEVMNERITSIHLVNVCLWKYTLIYCQFWFFYNVHQLVSIIYHYLILIWLDECLFFQETKVCLLKNAKNLKKLLKIKRIFYQKNSLA